MGLLMERGPRGDLKGLGQEQRRMFISRKRALPPSRPEVKRGEKKRIQKVVLGFASPRSAFRGK